MNIFAEYNPLFITGAALMAVSAAGALIALIVLRTSGRRLRDKLEAEFGKKRH